MSEFNVENAFRIISNDLKSARDPSLEHYSNPENIGLAIQGLEFVTEEQRRAENKNDPQRSLKAFVFAQYLSRDITIYRTQELREKAFNAMAEALLPFDVDGSENAKFSASKIIKALGKFDYGDDPVFLYKCINRLRDLRLTERMYSYLFKVIEKLRKRLPGGKIKAHGEERTSPNVAPKTGKIRR